MDGAVEDYLARAGERLERVTVEGYRISCRRLVEWAAANGVRTLDDLSPARLAAFKDWLSRTLKRSAARGGRRGERQPAKQLRSATSINHDLSRIRVFLHEARRLGRLPHADRDVISEYLGAVRAPRPRPAFLRRREITQLLEGCLRHDRDTFKMTRTEKDAGAAVANGQTTRHAPAGPFVLFMLLSGCRAKEGSDLRWEHLFLRGEAPEIVLPSAATKTRTERSVDLKVSPSLVDLLSRMRVTAEADPFVFGGEEPLSKNVVKKIHHRLKRYGAPEFTWQQLRQTCGTFLTNAPGIYGAASAWCSARRLGHSVVIAETRYVGLVRDIPADARTLEAAMGIGELAVEIVGALAPLIERRRDRMT